MSPLDVERLLWELGTVKTVQEESPQSHRPELNEETLRAYLAGDLDEAEGRAVEAALATSLEARERLAKLAGVRLPEPRSSLRDEILDRSFPAPPVAKPRRWWAAAGLAAAALLAVAVSLPLLSPPQIPADLSYEVSVTGLAMERSSAASSELIRAFPETRVRILVEPTTAAVDDIEMALYRPREGRLERLPLGGGIRLDTSRGSGAFEARAAELVGSETGIHRIFVVLARSGDLPASVRWMESEDPIAVLTEGSRRRVYPRRIQLESSR